MSVPAAPNGETPAQAYERRLVPALFAPSATLAARLAAIAHGERIVDVACGTAIGLRAAAAQSGSLGAAVGVDNDLDMVTAARDALDAAGVLADVLVASATALPLPDASFDVCLCLQGLQFFDDRMAALREMRRLLAGPGRLVVSTWAALEHVPGHRAVYAALEAQGIDTASPRRGFSLHEPHELLELATLAGFSEVSVEVEEREASFASSMHFIEALFEGAPYTRRVTASLSEHQRRRCVEDARQRLRPFESSSGLKLPLRSHLLLASVRPVTVPTASFA
ncbi:MAG TPA: class I SAM-dependent methyltransferase [Albitalea sp.]|uniref:class I SAM-dependent methyltransferase n=1 Tax=Piscinibacter sp. TaxID=1903157 RepID=UPI002ED58ED0